MPMSTPAPETVAILDRTKECYILAQRAIDGARELDPARDREMRPIARVKATHAMSRQVYDNYLAPNMLVSQDLLNLAAMALAQEFERQDPPDELAA